MPGATTTRGSQRPLPSTEVAAEHRAHLDGMRALAVYLVVLYHAGLDPVGSGYIGVDVFFVLSGYLVTQVLLRDLADHGTIRLRRFYARRYRRLGPAAFVMLMATAAGLTILGTAAQAADAEGGLQASFLYVANWYFIAQAADYFAADVSTNPVVHFWSLAVEEQFYLLWPLALGALHVATRRARHARSWVVAVVSAAALLSASAALHVSSSDLARAYYGTHTRGYQLLAGALLALTPAVVAWAARTGFARGSAAIAVVAIGALATSVDGLDPVERGIATAIATGVLIIAIEAAPDRSVVARWLAAPAVAYLGRVSYGTYLWHWPFIVLLGMEVTLAPVPLALVTALVSTALAAISHRALEQPVRTSRALDRRPLLVIAVGLSLSIVAALVLVPVVLSARPATSIDVDWRAAQRDNPPVPDCRPEHIAGCTVARGAGQHVVLLGDSNARMYIPAFTEIARREDLTLSIAVLPRCPWPVGLSFQVGGRACRAAQTFWYDELIRELDPDVVVVSQRPMDDPANPVPVVTPRGRFDFGDPGYDDAVGEVVRQTVRDLRSEGREVVLIEPIPIATRADDPLSCLSSTEDPGACTYDANAALTPIELVYRSEAGRRGIWSLDLDRLVCPRLPSCDPVVDGIVVKRDVNHITGTYSAHIGDAIADLLLREQVLR